MTQQRAVNPMLTALVENYDDLVRYLSRRLGGTPDVKDIVQDTFLKVHRLPAGTAIENPRAYLFRVAGNLALDRVRGDAVRNRRRVHGVQTDYPEHAPTPEHIADYRQRLQKLRRIVDGLPARQRQVFLMHKFDGMGHTEIAAALGISRSAVEKLIMKAMATCRDGMADLIND